MGGVGGKILPLARVRLVLVELNSALAAVTREIQARDRNLLLDGAAMSTVIADSLWALTAEHYPRLALRSRRRRTGHYSGATQSNEE